MDQSQVVLPFKPFSPRFAWSVIVVNTLALAFLVAATAANGWFVYGLPFAYLWQIVWAACHLLAGRRPALAVRLWHLGWRLAQVALVLTLGQGIVWFVQQVA